ncbi:uncharacterized protein ACRADG_012043 isoform 2-T2 [Cochliomyia hominivorax]
MEDMHWIEVGENECLTENLLENDTEFDDDVLNDGETSTSFSLEECMNEFRARRIRRTSLSYHRHESGVVDGIGSNKNRQETTERELINQNLCNKEQERKCKPCQNGFCYCFTSDSGDGGYNFDNINPIKQTRYRRSKLQCKQVPNIDDKNTKKSCFRGIGKDDSPQRQNSVERKTKPNTMASKKQLTAISSLETSSKDAPLIQIIQELRDNCVISEVKVNKYKIQSSQKNVKFKDQTKPTNKRSTDKKSYTFETEVHTPTAPTLDNFSELGNFQNKYDVKSSQLEGRKGCSQCSEKRRSSGGGQLLQKRLSNSQFNYKLRKSKEPPPKPPRSIHVDDDQCCVSSVSTTLSVRDAERVVDNFLKNKGYTLRNTDNKNLKTEVACDEGKPTSKYKGDRSKSYSMPPKSIRTPTESAPLTYSTLCDMKSDVNSKTSPVYGINIRPMSENVTKIISSGWDESKINDMLNYNANSYQKEFYSTATKAQPQHHPGCDVIGNTNTIGWQIPPKINLDTVDGFMRHNLASNVDNKNTPIKKKIMSPPKKEATRKFMWSKQLKNLSPWSNKHNTNDVREPNTNSRSFIKTSKKKILRLVSPKKENKHQSNYVIKRTPNRTIGVQTSSKSIPNSQYNIHDTRECSSQSPPGSYHSPIQSSIQSQNTTPNVQNEPSKTHFNFSRSIHSPPKKAPRSIQRKLNFPINYNIKRKEEPLKNRNLSTSSEHDKKTYRSFNSELDHDVSISKISHILSNIRAKLEANDDQAIRTFLETDNTDHSSDGFARLDSLHSKIHAEYLPLNRKVDHLIIDPIYSEIEDDSIQISESPKFNNNAEVWNLNPVKNFEVLYATVNKKNKQISDRNKSQLMDQKPQVPLAKIIHDSLKNKKIISNVTLLPPLPEPPESESGSCTSPTPLLHCQSLNNVRVMEHNSPPKNQRMLSKSDLSLYRSEIFLENLCRSELVVHSDNEQVNLEKVNNVPRRSYISMGQPSPNGQVCESYDNDKDLEPSDTISYELPNNYDDVDGLAESIDEYNTTTAGSNLGLSTIIPPSFHNQSTPKKQSFTTKDRTNSYVLNIDVEPISIIDHLNNSCPTTPYRQCNMRIVTQEHPRHTRSLKELTHYETVKYSGMKMSTGYSNIKNILHSSFRKSKKFIKAEGKRLSASFNFSMNKETGRSNLYRDKQLYTDLSLNLESLFCLNESASVNEQIAQTVSICRKLPDLEISTEMVEAERLLLFSTLRRNNQQEQLSAVKHSQTMNQKPKIRFFIDDMYLPVQSNVNQDIFFNYFYIVTFECGGVIKSTQSAECVNGTALFRDCGIEFSICSELKLNVPQDSLNNMDAVKCNIFMLRLRKISTISSDHKKRTLIDTSTQSPSTTLLSTSSSSFNEVVSRFRLHASFSLNATNFIPYEYVHKESANSDRICIRASCLCTIPLIPQTKYTNLSGQLRLKGRSEVRFPKHKFEGFLNVEDPYTQHNWNRRWCTLDGIFLSVWQDENCLNVSPLMVLDLRDTKRNMNIPLTYLAGDLCARPRSFCLQCTIRKASEDVSTATVFFAAETRDILNDWLNILNIVLDFIATWLK